MILKRFYNTNYTIGILTIDARLFFTLELPYQDNKQNISCIPEGEYKLIKYNSEKFKNCFKLLNVKNRTDILIHAGNVIENTQGCILIGCGLNINKDEIIILTESRMAVEKLNKVINELGCENEKVIIKIES